MLNVKYPRFKKEKPSPRSPNLASDDERFPLRPEEIRLCEWRMILQLAQEAFKRTTLSGVQLMNSASGSIGSIWLQKILKAARIGTAMITPTIPHIQPQNVSERRTRTGLSVSERPITIGEMKFPSSVARTR